MRTALCLEPEINSKWHYGREMCVEDIVTIRDATADIPVWDLMTLARIQKSYEDFGFKVRVLEGWIPMDNIKLGNPEGELELERGSCHDREYGCSGHRSFLLQLDGGEWLVAYIHDHPDCRAGQEPQAMTMPSSKRILAQAARFW